MYNQNAQPNPKTFIKTNAIIHLALLLGQVVFMAVSLTGAQDAALKAPAVSDPLFYILLVLIIASVFIGTFIYRKTLAQASNKPTLMAKLAVYQTAAIIRWAMSEGASLFGVVGFMLTNNYLYLYVTAVNVLYFVSIRPTKTKIQEELGLDYQQQGELEGSAL